VLFDPKKTADAEASAVKLKGGKNRVAYGLYLGLAAPKAVRDKRPEVKGMRIRFMILLGVV